MVYRFLTYSSFFRRGLVGVLGVFLTALTLYHSIGGGEFTFDTIVITGQRPQLAMLYREELTIDLSFIEYTYSGSDGLTLSILPGDGYDVLPNNQIVPTVTYIPSWPAEGVRILVNVQLSDGTDQSNVFPMEIVVIPPILALNYNESSCQGTISITASAYKPTLTSVVSFPFIFQLFDSEGNLFDERIVTNGSPFDQSATATFGTLANPLDREEPYRLVVIDRLGRVYERAAGPLGQAYSLDIAMNFSGLVCPGDNTGIAEFVINNAALPLLEFLVYDQNDNLVTMDYTIQSQEGGLVVAQVQNLLPGSYRVEIRDRFTCEGGREFELVIPNPLSFESDITPITCPENFDGSIRLDITGGWSEPFPGNLREQWTTYGVLWYSQSGELLGNSESNFILDGAGEIVGVRNELSGLTSGSYYAEIYDRGRVFEFPESDPLVCITRTPLFEIEGPEVLRLNSQFSNISCFGQQDGFISIDPTGGVGTYQITWYRGNFVDLLNPDPIGLTVFAPPAGTTPMERENLPGGDYAILLRDENGCFIAENFTIEEPAELAISENPDERVNILCFGETSGSFTLAIDQASTAPFLVQIHETGEEPGSTQTLTRNEEGPFVVSNLAAGEYSVIVTDARGCTEEIEGIELTQPSQELRIEGLRTSRFGDYQISCFGATDGFIDLFVTGGVGDYTFSWTGPNGFTADTETISGVSGGTYVFVVTDENGCSESFGQLTLEQPPQLTVSSEVSDFNGFQISCHGANDGYIRNVVQGGSGSYYVEWTGPNGFSSTEADISGLTPGTYELTISDDNGCALEPRIFEINEPDPLEIEEDESLREDVGCFGQETGVIHVDFLSSSVGPYVIELVESESPLPVRSISGFDGSSYTFENLSAGLYTVRVIDANGCQDTLEEIPIIQPENGLELSNLVVSNFNGFEISCHGAADGSISYILTGSQGDVSYSWQGLDGFTSNSPTLTGLGPGEYRLLVEDESGCTLEELFTLTEPDPLVLSDDVSDYNGFQIQCNGASDGFIRLLPSGGAPEYQFSWTGDNGFVSDAANLENIPAGTYIVTITDLNGCQITETYQITEPESLEITEYVDLRQNVQCFGESNGEIHVEITRPSAGPYNYYIQVEGEALGSAGSAENLLDTEWVFRNLPAGIYEVTVVDINGCTQSIDGLEITQPETGIAISEVRVEDYNGFQISCFGANDGRIEVVLSGGTGDYTYSWTGPNGFTASSPSIETLLPGSYELTISDDNGCVVETGPIDIIEPAPVSLTETLSDYNGFSVSCFGGNDGFIDLDLGGGTDTYTIEWNGPNGFTSGDRRIENLPAGTYAVLVTDENECVIAGTFELTEPPLLEASATAVVDVLCHGQNTGAISLNMSGGVSDNYSFAWFRDGNLTNEIDQNPANLFAGNYTVIVSDDNGCQVTLDNLVILEPPTPLTLSLTATEVSCYNANDGSITSEINGGVAPYQISWNFGSIQPNLTGLGPGLYELTVIDANGCMTVEAVTIPEVPVFDVDPEVGQVTCFGENDGYINLNLVGGQRPVRAIWDHGPEGAALFNLPPGEYGVTITEEAGCVIRREFIITEPDILIVTGIVEDALACDNGQSGSINLVVSGGRPPFQFRWSNGAETQNIQNLSSGQYAVEVLDSAGCFATQRFQVRRPRPIEVSTVQYQEAQCEPREIKTVFELNIDGGVAPYTIQWSSGQVSNDGYRMESEEPGLYTVTVTDAAGCQYVESHEVANSRVVIAGEYRSQSFLQYQAHLVNFDMEFINQSSGDIRSFYWDFGDGNASDEANPVHRYQSEGTYDVTLRAVDAFECEHIFPMQITILDHFMMVPNIFSPNADGMNDYFVPKFLQVASMDFRIMNKWGEIVFHSNELQTVGWDGRLNGEEAIPGNYVYQVKYSTMDGRPFTKTGVFLLVR
ncbi:PKD domain-containing protein [Lunatimonas salinarum]|uniref:PKD domain-containing protein n=1 Tax=Lunatimonas salinarum TaxID=1774590 RepID=UPI001AE00821|nr:PKD domain-containing protein [Lunatimonas salinarum]